MWIYFNLSCIKKSKERLNNHLFMQDSQISVENERRGKVMKRFEQMFLWGRGVLTAAEGETRISCWIPKQGRLWRCRENRVTEGLFIQTPPQTVWAFPFHPGLLQTPLLTNIYNTDQVIDWNLCLTTFKPLQLIKISPSVSLCRIKLFSSTSSNRIICIEVVRRRFLKKNRHPPASPRVFHSR